MLKYVCNRGEKAMDNNIRKRIDELKAKNGFKTDSDIIGAIFRFKKNRGQIGKIKEFEYIDKNKGSFSQYFNGHRDFKPEDYLAIEYVLNTSMAYIIEGRGEISNDFKPSGIRYAAFTDTQGNYEELMRDDIVNSSDEYNKMLIDYMIEYKSKNGFIYFAERNLLPLTSTGGANYEADCLHFYPKDNKKLLKVLCESLPINLLIKYFNGFPNYQDIVYSQIDDEHNTSFTDDVIADAIKRSDLRNELIVCKKINLDSFNRGVKLSNGKSLGEGLFVNYFLTIMIKYVLNHDIDNEIRLELLNNALKVNKSSFDFVSSFAEEELKIDKHGYITDMYGNIYYGSIVIPSEISVEMSEEAKNLVNQLARQVHDYHEFISSHSKISIFRNEILADKQSNQEYYHFFKIMNSKGVSIVPIHKIDAPNDKDLFEVSNSEKSRIANGTDEDLREILASIRILDNISTNELNGMTYYLVDPSIYIFDGKVNYIMPKNVFISNKYSNIVRLINDYSRWNYFDTRGKTKINWFIRAIKTYGIEKAELDEFIRCFIVLSEEQASSFDKTSDRGKELALNALGNKDWLEIYRDIIVKEF